VAENDVVIHRAGITVSLRSLAYALSQVAEGLDDRANKHPSLHGGLARAAMRLVLFILESIEKGEVE